jgi:hypothetical protein
MGLFLRFFFRPYPRGWGADIADNRLPALGDMNALGAPTGALDFDRLSIS